MTPTSYSGNRSDQPISALLEQLNQGNRDAINHLIPLVYKKLHRAAALRMRRERGNHTLQPTALVNEVWLRLVDQPRADWKDGAHFFAVSSQIMHQILVDHARRRNAVKRGGTQIQVAIENALCSAQEPNAIDVLVLHDLLEQLRKFDPRACRIVEMHYFGGLSHEQMAEVLQVSTRTVKRDWRMARAWLRDQFSKKQ